MSNKYYNASGLISHMFWKTLENLILFWLVGLRFFWSQSSMLSCHGDITNRRFSSVNWRDIGDSFCSRLPVFKDLTSYGSKFHYENFNRFLISVILVFFFYIYISIYLLKKFKCHSAILSGNNFWFIYIILYT